MIIKENKLDRNNYPMQRQNSQLLGRLIQLEQFKLQALPQT